MLIVSTPLGESFSAELLYKSSVVKMEDKELLADLILLDMQDYDVILGMDWLSAYHGITCHLVIPSVTRGLKRTLPHVQYQLFVLLGFSNKVVQAILLM